MKIQQLPETPTDGLIAEEWKAQEEVRKAVNDVGRFTDEISDHTKGAITQAAAAIWSKGPAFAQKCADLMGHEVFLGICYATAEENWTRVQRGEVPVAVIPEGIVFKVNGTPVDFNALLVAWQTLKGGFVPAGAVVAITA